MGQWGEKIIIWDDDGPDGHPETTRMEIQFAGNLDWYIRMVGANWGGDRVFGPSFRASTSGSKCGVITSIVAMLASIGQGDRDRALVLARNVVTSLEAGWDRMPPERIGNSVFELNRAIESGEVVDRESAIKRMEWTREYLDEVASHLDSVPWEP